MPNEFDRVKIKHFQLRMPEIKTAFGEELYMATFQRALIAQVVKHQDKVLCDAIIKYATENGYTDLFLIDEEFIRSAIVHEIERRTADEQAD